MYLQTLHQTTSGKTESDGRTRSHAAARTTYPRDGRYIV